MSNRFWGVILHRRARINNVTENLFQMHGSKVYNQLTGDKGDISNLCRFKWFDWCYFCDSNQAFTLNTEKIGGVLGTMREEGN